MQNDNFNQIAFNVSTVFDLLDTKGISWGVYQEDMPYSGFEGMQWLNQKSGANDYVRKHNPAVIFDSVAHFEDRLSQLKNLSLIDQTKSQFHLDLQANKLPQWMFITPNMTSDAHDATISFAGNWLNTFLTPLLADKNFMQNTLVLITFDENSNYAIKNNILSIVLGDAVPASLVGTTDASFYNHYSEISTVEANWDLPTLGRWDVGANVFKVVADQTGDKVREWDASFNFAGKYFFNSSYAGPFNTAGGLHEYAAPNLALDNSVSGRKILDSIKNTWKDSKNPTYYRDAVEVNDGINPPAGFSL
jgi:acid phosphatase